MNKLKLISGILFLFLFSSCADREIYEDITNPGVDGLFKELNGNVSGTLTIQDSPYKVSGDIVVPSNSSLTINPGVELYFVKDARLIVNGKLIVQGNPYYTVLFAAYDKNLNWRGIKFFNSLLNSTIDFAEIREIRENGDSTYSSSISIINSSVEITHSIIYQNSAVSGGAIGIDNSTVVIKNNILRDNKADTFGGTIIAEQSDLTLINNTLFQNKSSNCCGGVFVLNPQKTDIQNNIFYKNSSFSGNPHFVYSSEDSSTLIEQYNYFAFGNMDPLFYTDFDLRLYYLSPCKDAGNPDTVFNDYNGTRNDQGAYGGPLGNW